MANTLTAIKPNSPAKAQHYFEDKMQFTTGPVELNRLIEQQKQQIVVVDVRETEDYEKGHMPGAINLPKDQWSTFKGLVKEKQNILYCYSEVCHLAATAAVEFARAGFPVMELQGGWDEWKEYGMPIESGGRH